MPVHQLAGSTRVIVIAPARVIFIKMKASKTAEAIFFFILNFFDKYFYGLSIP
jgi:hypothetical protein